MSKVVCWPEATSIELRRLRDAGKSWEEVGDALQICPRAAQRAGKRMGLNHAPAKRRAGPLPLQPRVVAQTQAVQRKPEQLACKHPILPPGATLELLTAGMCLDGQPYPDAVERRA